MAEETQQKSAASETPAASATVEAVAVEKPAAVEKETPPPPQPEPEAESPTKPAATPAVEEAAEAEKPKTPTAAAEDAKKISQSVSFKEETNVVSELPEAQRKALDELKLLVQDALNKHEFKAPPPPPPQAKEEEKEKPATEETPKADEKAPAAEEASKAEEKKPEASTEAVASEEPSKEEPKEEEKAEEAHLSEPAAPAETVVVAEVVETVTAAVDEDGAKTVEAIKESIVAVTPPEPKETETTVAIETTEAAAEPQTPPEEVSIWGIPLLQDDRSDVVLLKFLRARDFKPKDAFTMIRNTVRWREEFKIEALLEEDLGANDFEKAVFMSGTDREGHPVCYNVYGEFQNKELYQAAFSSEEKRQRFLRWRIQFLEKSIRKLDFSPSGISTMVQVNDLKNSPGPAKTGLRQATNQALHLLQDNYPEFVAKQVFINVPWWYLAFNTVISAFLTLRTKSKFVFAGSTKSADTLFRYIAPEQVPARYGGLSREGEQEFSVSDAVTEVTLKPATKHTVEFSVPEKSTLVWEVRVVGWEVSYGSEFVPTAEDGYTVIVQKARKVAPADETVISDAFRIGEPGKVVLTIDNQTSKKKKLLYRSKTKPSTD